MNALLSSIVAILAESAPYLLLGFALAGVLHVTLARFPSITARLTRPGRRSVLFGALIGVPMPLCSCSVLPAAMALRRDGASKGATASFLVSVPETDIVSILVTLALIGPVMAVYRPVAAIVSALATGLAIDAFTGREERPRAAVAAPADCHCATAPVAAAAPVAGPAPWWKRAFRYGFVEIFDDIILQLLLGIVIAAAIGTWLPAVDAATLGGGAAMQYVVMAAIGVPLYVCATASTPIAAGFIAGGISPGAALVFLLAGPATNAASLVVLRSEFGTRFLAVYLAAIVASSVALGVLFDLAIGSLPLPALQPAIHAHDGLSALRIAALVAFLLATAAGLHRTRSLQRGYAGLKRLSMRLVAR
jgi:uncharacterized membrane protein YraQ (UPF0718 family)